MSLYRPAGDGLAGGLVLSGSDVWNEPPFGTGTEADSDNSLLIYSYEGASYMQSGVVIKKDSSNYLSSFFETTTSWGLKGVKEGSAIFELGSTNQIAGWSFNTKSLFNADEKVYIGDSSELAAAVEHTYIGTLPIPGGGYKGFRVYGEDSNNFIGITVADSTSATYFISKFGSDSNKIIIGQKNIVNGDKGVWIDAEGNTVFFIETDYQGLNFKAGIAGAFFDSSSM